MRYARFVAAFAAFVLLFWSGGGGVGGRGLIAPCLLFQLLANDVHACVCIYIYIYVYIDVYIQIDIHMYIGLCTCMKTGDEAVGMKVSRFRPLGKWAVATQEHALVTSEQMIH